MWRKLVGIKANRKHNMRSQTAPVRARPNRRAEVKQAATLSEQQLRRVLEHCRSTRSAQRNRAIVLMTHWAGMRIGEVAALRWGDVVGADGQVRSEIRLSSQQTKGHRARIVLLPERLRVELAAYVAVVKGRSASSPLFATQRSEGFTANTLTHIVNGLYRKAGIDGATSHSGRRSFITNLAERGVSARVLMSLAGHQNLSTTQRYIDLKPSMLRAAVELV